MTLRKLLAGLCVALIAGDAGYLASPASAF